MARPTSTFKQTDMRTALKVMQAAGLTVAGSEIAPDGTIRIFTTMGQSSSPPSSLEKWKAKRNASST